MSETLAKKRIEKAGGAFRTISEVSETLEVQQHVLRFWETKFTQIKPVKRGGGRRYYRPEDIEVLRYIQDLLYNEGYTIKGVQKLLKTQTKAELMQAAGLSASSQPSALEAAVVEAVPQMAVSIETPVVAKAPEPLVAVRSSTGAIQQQAMPKDAIRARQMRQRSILEAMLGDMVELRDSVRAIREACAVEQSPL